MEDTVVEEPEVSCAAEFAPALVAAHPHGNSVAVAIGPELRAFDLRAGMPVSLSDDCGGRSHSDAIRAICFSVSGALFASAGDDKLVKVWKTDSWHCIQTITSEKRVSAVAISNDDLHVTFADKFGVVWLVTLREDSAEQVSVDNKPVSILGHYCSIITSMKFSPDGRFIATADRDFKIRVTLFPKNPLKGAHEIQSFCLGHTDFVSCITFTSISENQSFLISGGGDSTVRLWDYVNGCLLDTFQVRDKMGELLGPNETDDSSLAIADICPSNDGSLVAVAIQGLFGTNECKQRNGRKRRNEGLSLGHALRRRRLAAAVPCAASQPLPSTAAGLPSHAQPHSSVIPECQRPWMGDRELKEEDDQLRVDHFGKCSIPEERRRSIPLIQTVHDVIKTEDLHSFEIPTIQTGPQSFSGVMLLACDLVGKKLSFLKVITMEKSYIPTSLASSLSSELLWTVMGAANMPNQASSHLLTRLRIIPCFQKGRLSSDDAGPAPATLEDGEVPHGEKLLLALQGSLDMTKQEQVLASVLAALKVSMHKMLVKKHYSEERREQRKRGRNDKKIKN